MTTMEAVRAELLANGAVTALVGDRIFPQIAPQNAALPLVVMTIIYETPLRSLTGTAATRRRNARVQIDVYSKSYARARELASAIEAAIGDTARPDFTADLLNTEDIYDAETEDHRVLSEFSVWV